MKEGIYGYEERLERCRRIIAGFGANGEIALLLISHSSLFMKGLAGAL